MTAALELNVSKTDYNVLEVFTEEWRQIMAGEERLAKLIYLICTSRLLDRPMHAVIKGPSGAGKSEIRKQVLKFFPSEDVISLTAMSEKALIYAPQDFRHVILSMAEATAKKSRGLQDLLLREMMSDGRFSYSVKGRGLFSETITKEGPCAFLITTTLDALNPENENRMLSLHVDDSPIQTRRVLRKLAEDMDDDSPVLDHLPLWHQYQRRLRMILSDIERITVPFGCVLGDMVPASHRRIRRDFGHLLTAIKAHALLQHEHRINKDGQLLADLTDYGAVRDLLVDVFADPDMQPTMRETLKALAEIQPDIGGVTALQLARHLGISKSAALRRLQDAVRECLVINQERRRGQPGRYRTDDEVLNPLPTAEKVAAAWRARR